MPQPSVRRAEVFGRVGTLLSTGCDLGVNGKIVTDRLGHANEAVTQQIYTHPSTGQDRAAAEMIASLIAEALDRRR